MRRFIAGAVCPRCGKMDKLVVDSDTEQRECVSCGFADARPSETPAEIKTRVNQPVRRVDTAAEPVKLVQPSPSDD